MNSRINFEQLISELIINERKQQGREARHVQGAGLGSTVSEEELRRFCERLLDALERRERYRLSGRNLPGGQSSENVRAFGYL